MRRSLIALAGCVMLSLIPSARAWCFHEAGARYHINAELLRSIAVWESALDPRAIGVNRKGGTIVSRDYGLMQINSRHLPRLKCLGIIRSENDLLTHPCLNVQVGAWILAQHLQTCGANWSCRGSYNAGFSAHSEVAAPVVFAACVPGPFAPGGRWRVMLSHSLLMALFSVLPLSFLRRDGGLLLRQGNVFLQDYGQLPLFPSAYFPPDGAGLACGRTGCPADRPDVDPEHVAWAANVGANAVQPKSDGAGCTGAGYRCVLPTASGWPACYSPCWSFCY